MSHNASLIIEVTILVLAIFLGFEVISKVPPLLHTPLMSGTNAIHGIVDCGRDARRRLRNADGLTRVVGFVAVVLALGKRRRRLRRHRPDARDVQEASRGSRDEPKTPTDVSSYLVSIVSFILALRFLSSRRRRGAETRSAPPGCCRDRRSRSRSPRWWTTG